MLGTSLLHRLAMLSLLPFLAACPDSRRCRFGTDCEQGETCSNERNPQGDGVCISPCERHIAAEQCVDAAPPPLDAATDVPVEAGASDATADSEVDR